MRTIKKTEVKKSKKSIETQFIFTDAKKRIQKIGLEHGFSWVVFIK